LRVTVTGATGLLGKQLVGSLRAAGAEVTVLSRDPQRARELFAGSDQAARSAPPVTALAWDLMSEPAPLEALVGRDAVLHLAGENVAQRWSAKAKAAIRESREHGTRNLVEGIAAIDAAASSDEARPRVLVSSSAIGYYGPHAQEPIDEEAPPGDDFLARTCVIWEQEAQAAVELGLRVVKIRTGVVLDADGGALAKMLPPFKLGVGGPVAGGAQYISWIHREDLVGMMLAALRDKDWAGPINATAPEPATNSEFSQVLGHVLHRPSLLPVPGFALRALYGEMAEIVTTGARVMPAKPLMLGYEFKYPLLEPALREALS
jgi:uncharacterized protein